MTETEDLFDWLDKKDGGVSVLQHSQNHADFFEELRTAKPQLEGFGNFSNLLPLLFHTRGKFRDSFLAIMNYDGKADSYSRDTLMIDTINALDGVSSVYHDFAELADKENVLEIDTDDGARGLKTAMNDQAGQEQSIQYIIEMAYSPSPTVAVDALDMSRVLYAESVEMQEFVYRMVRHLVLDRNFGLSKVLL